VQGTILDDDGDASRHSGLVTEEEEVFVYAMIRMLGKLNDINSGAPASLLPSSSTANPS
jgi:hypothetical protein